MSFQSIVVMAGSQSLRARMAAAAAAAGLEDPLGFVDRNMWQLASTAAWDTAWDTAATAGDNNMNPDTGVRTDVITDTMIEDAINARLAEIASPPPPPDGESPIGIAPDAEPG